MGRSSTPTFRVEYSDQGGNHHAAWSGPASGAKLVAWLRAGIDSMAIGGCNEHVSKMLGYIPVPYKAQIIRQSTGEVVINWKAPAFWVV